MLDACREVGRRYDVPYVGRAIGPDDTHGRREDDQERHDRYQAENFGKNQVVRRVYPHDFKSINLLGYAHRSQFRGNVGSHLPGQDKTHDGTGKLKKHDLPRRVSGHPAWHPWTFDVYLHLDADHSPNEERNQEHDRDGIDP